MRWAEWEGRERAFCPSFPSLLLPCLYVDKVERRRPVSAAKSEKHVCFLSLLVCYSPARLVTGANTFVIKERAKLKLDPTSSWRSFDPELASRCRCCWRNPGLNFPASGKKYGSLWEILSWSLQWSCCGRCPEIRTWPLAPLVLEAFPRTLLTTDLIDSHCSNPNTLFKSGG